jgi:ATP diphosphatase
MNIWKRLVDLEVSSQEFGLKWPSAQEILAQIESECREIQQHIDAGDCSSEDLGREIGDLMHAVMSLSWFCGFDSKTVLSNSCDKFEKRLNKMKQLSKAQGEENLKHKSFSELMLNWEAAKRELDQG